MKKILFLCAGMLVSPAVAEVAPMYYDDIVEYTEDAVVDGDVVENIESEQGVVTPVVQPSKVGPRGSIAAGRAAARAVPASGAKINARSVNSRSVTTARGTTTARTGVVPVRSGVASRNVQSTNNARVTTRPSRVATTGGSVGVASRRVSGTNNTNDANTARVGVAAQTTAAPLYTGRVTTRASSGIRARMPSTISLTSSSTTETTTEEKQQAVSQMDDIAQLSDYCKAQYTSCMDNFCNVLDENQGRCSCSKNIKNYEKTENALKQATESLQDVAQQIQYIGLTGDEIDTLFHQTEAEEAMQATTDNTQLKNDLENIKEMIVGIKTGTATSSETGLNFDLSGLLDFNIDNTGFDLSALFGGTTANTNSISNQRGEQLYKTAAARCKASVLTSCQNQGVDIAVITNSYDMEIDKQCVLYERQLIDANDNMVRTVRNAKAVLQKARLMVAQQKNTYDLRGCVNALDSCMQDDFVCGTDYENCLDPSGKYIVNGEVVIGSAPGFWLDTTGEGEADEVLATPVQHQGGIYGTWLYKPEDSSTDLHAWYGKDTTLAAYIDTSIEQTNVKETSNNMVKYLQYKIGYNEDNRNYGMCVGVLNKCQLYTYKDGVFQSDNLVVREYLQRTLTQIKVAQDDLISSYAEKCISDVTSCLSSNSYMPGATNNNFAINACKAQITTCMSVNGQMDAAPTPTEMVEWVEKVHNRTGANQESE